MEYFVLKHVECEICKGDGKEKRRSLMIAPDLPIECHECRGYGYIETTVDLLEVLKRLQQPDYIDGQLIGYDSLLSDKAYFRED